MYKNNMVGTNFKLYRITYEDNTIKVYRNVKEIYDHLKAIDKFDGVFSYLERAIYKCRVVDMLQGVIKDIQIIAPERELFHDELTAHMSNTKATHPVYLRKLVNRFIKVRADTYINAINNA